MTRSDNPAFRRHLRDVALAAARANVAMHAFGPQIDQSDRFVVQGEGRITTEDAIRFLFGSNANTYYPDDARSETQYDPMTDLDGQPVRHIHHESKCRGEYCVIHNPSDHHMREWRRVYAPRLELTVRFCPHTVAHPDPDAVQWLIRRYGLNEALRKANHDECDGCCHRPTTSDADGDSRAAGERQDDLGEGAGATPRQP